MVTVAGREILYIILCRRSYSLYIALQHDPAWHVCVQSITDGWRASSVKRRRRRRRRRRRYGSYGAAAVVRG